MTEHVIAKLEAIPVWANVPPDEAIDRGGILEILHEIDSYSTDVMREAIITYYKPAASVEDMGRLLLVNKFLFQLPEWIPTKSYQSFGGWLGVPNDGDLINLLWPFRKDPDGTLVLAGRYQGYMGEAYLAEQAFEHYLNTYGRRNEPSVES